MLKRSSFEPANALLGDPEALREQMFRDGFLFFRELLPSEEILALRRKILEICQDQGWLASGTALMEGIAGPRVDEIEPFCGVGVPADAYAAVQRLESFHRLAHHPQIIEVFSRLFQETVLPHPRNIARLMVPSPSNAPTPAHQDYVFIQGTRTVYSCWLPLGDCPRELGGLSVLQGSHRLGVLPLREAQGAGDRVVILDGIKEQNWFEGDFTPGDALIFHSLTVHKAFPNQTRNRIRLSVDFRYQPVSLPIEEKSLKPHCDVLTWEEIYDGWQSEELQYYWQQYALDLQEFDMSLVALAEE